MFDPDDYKAQKKQIRLDREVAQTPTQTLVLISQGESTMSKTFSSEIPEEVIIDWSYGDLTAELSSVENGKYTYKFTF